MSPQQIHLLDDVLQARGVVVGGGVVDASLARRIGASAFDREA